MEREKRDLVIGAIDKYNFEQIAPWVNSLDRSGFSGIKAVVAYNINHATCEELTKRGYSILAFQRDPVSGDLSYPSRDYAVVTDRFLHYYLMLNNPQNAEGIRYVIATDAKDVIFQRNPSDFLNGCNPGIVASSEGIAYEHEPWGRNNLTQSFGPLVYEQHKTNTIINCGVLAGTFSHFMGLCKSIYLMSHGTVQHVPGGGGPDQAALNLLLSTEAYKECTMVTTHADAWACQAGTTMDPNKIDSYRPHITESLPRFYPGTGEVMNASGEPYTLVHQWDRVPEIRAAVEKRYR
jgi:hypothetical protein